jgi:hypothetical protein
MRNAPRQTVATRRSMPRGRRKGKTGSNQSPATPTSIFAAHRPSVLGIFTVSRITAIRGSRLGREPADLEQFKAKRLDLSQDAM